MQVYDTPDSHVTRDYKEGLGRLGDLLFKVLDTSGLEPQRPQHTIQVCGRIVALVIWMFLNMHQLGVVVFSRAFTLLVTQQ